MIRKAAKYPFHGNWKFRHIIGSVFVLFSWTIFPLIALVGYYIQTLTFTSIGRDDPPEFDSFVSLSKVGGVGTAIIFSYSGFFIATPLLTLSIIASRFVTPETMSQFVTVMQVITYVTLAFTLLMTLILPVILCRYARTGSFRQAYNVKTIITLLKTKVVLKAMGTTVLLGVLSAIAYMIFVIITFGFGVIFTPLYIFWFVLASAYIYGVAIGTVTGTIESIPQENFVDGSAEGTGGPPSDQRTPDPENN